MARDVGQYPSAMHRDGPFRRWQVALLWLAFAVATVTSASAQKTDVVTLTNGDRLTCEVKLLERGRLQADTDNLSTVYIEWDTVASVKTSGTFQVETSTGLRLLGQLATTRNGALDVLTATGTITVDFREVVYIAPIGRSFWSKLDGSLDLGMSYTQSSGVAQVNLSSSATFRRPNLQLTLAGSSYFTHQQDADNTSRHTLQLTHTRSLLTQSLWMVLGGFESNPDLGYDLRSTVSAGLGHYFVRSNRAIFALGGGLSVNEELPVDGEAVENLDAFASMRQSYFTYDFPKTSLSLAADLYPSLSNWGRTRVEFNGSLKREIIRDFTVGVTAYDSYDSRPPTVDARKNDFGLTITVGWTF